MTPRWVALALAASLPSVALCQLTPDVTAGRVSSGGGGGPNDRPVSLLEGAQDQAAKGNSAAAIRISSKGSWTGSAGTKGDAVGAGKKPFEDGNFFPVCASAGATL